MSWVKLDDAFFDNDKIVAVGRDARDLYLAGLCYCARSLTDGFIPEDRICRLALEASITDIKEAIQRLTRVVRGAKWPLWETTQGGYVVHDYREYNPCADDVKKQREENKRRQAAWYAGRKHRDGRAFGTDGQVPNAQPNGVTDGVTNSVRTETLTALPSPSPFPFPKEINKGADAPNVAAVILTETAQDYLKIMGRKRFQTNAQRDAFLSLEEEVGRNAISQAARWAAENGITKFDSFRTCARNIAKNGITPMRPEITGASRGLRPQKPDVEYESLESAVAEIEAERRALHSDGDKLKQY